MRYLILFSAVLMQMCLGATYSWSIYVQPIKALTGMLQGPVQLPFTVFYFVFPLTMMFSGTLMTKIGPRISAMVGGLLFGGGWVVASFAANSFALATLGIGMLSGIGAGLAYIVPIAVCISWFPRHKGLVTGIAVAGFGGGAALVSQVGAVLMENMGKTPFETFFIFGALFISIIVTASLFFRFPEEDNAQPSSSSVSAKEILNHPLFRLLYVSMFIGLAAGFTINANLKQLFQDPENALKIGVTGVSLFALANASGRIFWGMLFDRIEVATAVQANLFFQALVLLIAPTVLASSTGFLLVATITGFNYGGVLVIYVSSVSRYWGAKNVSRIYGWLFSSNIPASFAPMMAGMLFDSFGNFDSSLYGLSFLLFVATVVARTKFQKAGMVPDPGKV